jgi:2-polyprenyl-3-methyl-5-hydroxy-6-metoxy-1,4-benzoquinol methylase
MTSPRLMDDVQFEAHQAHEESHWWFTARREIILSVVDFFVRGEPNPFILDVGCGTGCTVAEFSKHYEAVGIDASVDAIRRARVRYPECKFIHGRVPSDVADLLGRVKLITLMDVLEHVEDDRGLLESLIENVSDGTVVVITVPADMSLWSEHDVVLGHFRRYDPRRLASLLTDLSAECLLLAPLNSRLEPAVRFMRTIKPRLISSRGAAGTDLRMPPRYLNDWLHSIFAGEKACIMDRLARREVDMNCRGVSLLAVIRKSPGTHAPRKPR